MEHTVSNFISDMLFMRYWRILFFWICLVLVGCEKPNPTPELGDPIFQDIQSQMKSSEKELVDAEKAIQDASAAIEKIVPQDGTYKILWEKYFQAKKNKEQVQERGQFLAASLDRRKKLVRKRYREAWNSGTKKLEVNASELEDYKQNRKLATDSRDWSTKTKYYRPVFTSTGEAPKKAEPSE